MMDKRQISGAVPNKPNSFLEGWIIHNFLGWGIACLITIPALFWIRPFILRLFADQFAAGIAAQAAAKADAVISIVIWLPFGIALGTLQWLELRRLNVRAVPWILTTTLAWVIPITFLIWLFDTYHIIYFEAWGDNAQILEVLIVGLLVGSSQAIIMHKLSTSHF